MLYDCFTFFDELDVLDIRLHELASVVDKFVLVESTKTFRNKDKPLYYTENKQRFIDFADKIIHVVVTDTPAKAGSWEVETFQRNAIMRGLTQCHPSDSVLLSDVDEIPRGSTIALNNWEAAFTLHKCFWFCQTVSYYYLNYISNILWNGTRLIQYKNIDSPQAWRDRAGPSLALAGWHMSYLGTPERISSKIAAFAHTEYDTPQYNNLDHLTKCMEQGKDLFNRQDIAFEIKPAAECNLPEYVQKNLDKFKHLVKE